LRLTWSLFDGGSTISRERQASYRAKEDESALRSVYTRLPREFLTWKKKFFYNVSLYQARVKTLEQSQESVRLSMAGAKAGTRTNTEVLDAELDLFRARAGIIRAQSDAIEALNELELAVGYPLWKGI
jgi:outer membrane protein TolC